MIPYIAQMALICSWKNEKYERNCHISEDHSEMSFQHTGNYRGPILENNHAKETIEFVAIKI